MVSCGIALARKLLLVQPSSTTAERVFSVLSTLSAQQEGALKDYIEASVMIRYNNNQRKLSLDVLLAAFRFW